MVMVIGAGTEVTDWLNWKCHTIERWMSLALSDSFFLASVYIYIYVCVCMYVPIAHRCDQTYTHNRNNIYIYIYINIYKQEK